MKKSACFLYLFTFCLISFSSFAQEEVSSLNEAESGLEFEEGNFGVAFILGHTYVYGGDDVEGNSLAVYVPMIALDINYFFGELWNLGLHTDFLFETIQILEEDGLLVERERPIAPAVIIGRRLGKNWGVGVGIGAEFAGEETYMLNRVTLEYGKEIGEGWEVFGMLSQDFRWNIYNTTTFGFGLSHRF